MACASSPTTATCRPSNPPRTHAASGSAAVATAAAVLSAAAGSRNPAVTTTAPGTLVERLAVGVHGWVTPAQFGTAVGLSYATPGPVLIIAAYIGYRTAGLAGALAATVAVFAVPVLAAVGAAGAVQRLAGTGWLPAFGRTAGAAAIGLLALTLLSLARPVADVHPALLVASLLVAVGARRAHPLLLLGVAVLAGVAVGSVAG